MMKKLISTVILLFIPSLGMAQGIRYFNQILSAGGVPNPTIRVCTEPAIGTPCTPLATIFSDSGLTVPLANPFTGDAQGNFFFYANPSATYHAQVSGLGINPYDMPDITLPGGGGGAGGTIVKVNGQAVPGVAANLNSTVPAAPVSTINVQWQKDANGINTGVSANVPYASATGLGVIQLTGDLCNTASVPQVCGIHLGAPMTIGNGGTGQTTAAAAFNALAPATAAGGLIVGSAANAYANLPIGANNTCLTSNGTSVSWLACAAASITGSGGSPFLAKFSAGTVLASSTVSDAGGVVSTPSTLEAIQGTAATGGANQSSPLFGVVANYWNGSTSATDTYTWQDVLGTGTNPSAILTLAHSGSTGVSGIQFPVVGMGIGAGSVPGGGSTLVAASGPPVISQLDLEAGTITEITNPYHNIAYGLNVKPSANSSVNYSLQKLVIQVDPTNTSTITDSNNFVKGTVIDVFGGGSAATRLRGIDLYVNQQGTAASGTAGNRFQVQPASGTVSLTSNYGLELLTGGAGTWTGTTSVDAGLYIDSPQVPSGSTLSTHYGIYIEDQTTGGAGNVNPFAFVVAAGKSVFQGPLIALAPGTLDISGASSSIPWMTGTGVPNNATCTKNGMVFFRTDGTPGQQLYFCNTGVWTLQLNTGGAGGTIWSNLTAPGGNLSLGMGNFATTLTGGTALTAPVLTIADTTADTFTGYLEQITATGTSTAKGLNVTVPTGGSAITAAAGSTGFAYDVAIGGGSSHFNRLCSTSTGAPCVGTSIGLGATDPIKNNDSTRTGGAVTTVVYQGVGYSGNPGAPFPFAAGIGQQFGDVEPVMFAGPLTSLTPGASMTIQPYPQTTLNGNGGNVNINAGTANGTGNLGGVVFGGTGFVQFNIAGALPYVNSPANSTVLNQLVSYDTANLGKVRNTIHGATSGVQGICVQNCSTAGSAVVAIMGAVSLNMDVANTVNIGDYVCISATTDGFGTDCATPTTQTIGTVQAFVSGSLYTVQINVGSPSGAGGGALNALVSNPLSTSINTAQPTGANAAITVALTGKCGAGAAAAQVCGQFLTSAGVNILNAQQGGTVQIGTGVAGTVTASQFIGPNSNPALTGILNASNTDIAVAWRNNANSSDITLGKDVNDRVNLNTSLSITGTLTATSKLVGQVDEIIGGCEDVRKYFIIPFNPAPEQEDFGLAIQKAFTAVTAASGPLGVYCVDASNVVPSASGQTTYGNRLFANTNPWALLANLGGKNPDLKFGNTIITTSVQWETPGGGTLITGAPETGTVNIGNNIVLMGSVLSACNDSGGCGPFTYPRFTTATQCLSGSTNCFPVKGKFAASLPATFGAGTTIQIQTNANVAQCGLGTSSGIANKVVCGFSGTPAYTTNMIGGVIAYNCTGDACVEGSATGYYNSRIVNVIAHNVAIPGGGGAVCTEVSGTGGCLILEAKQQTTPTTQNCTLISGTAFHCAYLLFAPNVPAVFCDGCLGSGLNQAAFAHAFIHFGFDVNGVAGAVGYLCPSCQERTEYDDVRFSGQAQQTVNNAPIGALAIWGGGFGNSPQSTHFQTSGSINSDTNTNATTSNIATTGAVRNGSNSVTLTTDSPHGMVAGQIIKVIGTTYGGATSFNGLFTIGSVTSTTITYPQTGEAGTSTGHVGTVNTGFGLIIDGWAVVQGKGNGCPTRFNFGTIVGQAASLLVDAAVIDGCDQGNAPILEGPHIEWISNDGINIGSIHPVVGATFIGPNIANSTGANAVMEFGVGSLVSTVISPGCLNGVQFIIDNNNSTPSVAPCGGTSVTRVLPHPYIQGVTGYGSYPVPFATYNSGTVGADIAVGTNTLYTTNASGSMGGAGDYRICAHARTILAGTGSVNPTVQIQWNDGVASKTFTGPTWSLNSTTVTGEYDICKSVRIGTSATVRVGTTGGTYGTSTYVLSANVEQIGPP